jgi:hypothetical protein
MANPGQIGTFSATSTAAWDPKGKAPADEEAKFHEPFEVGRGHEVETPYAEVARRSGRVRDVISVRYKKMNP